MPKEKVTPPKKKMGSKTDKKTKSNADAAGGLSGEGPIQETRAELLAKIQAVEREAVKANEHRNYMQLERDKIDSFWEITKAELESTKVDLRDAQRELEVAGEKHEMELRLQTHKLKQVKHERLETEYKVRAEYDQAEAQLRDDCRDRLQIKSQELEAMEAKIREIRREHEDRRRRLKLEHNANLSAARKQFEQSASERVNEVERETFDAMDSFKCRIEKQLADTEARYSTYIDELVETHTNAYAELKQYFNSLTDTQVVEIERLEQRLDATVERLYKQTRELNEIRNKNAALVVPLTQAEHKCEEYKKKLSHSERKCKHLEYSEKALRDLQSQLKSTKWQNEILIQKLEKNEKDLEALRREEMSNRFCATSFAKAIK
jgi:DNA repair exonuclease SbcCD ATPase subunit